MAKQWGGRKVQRLLPLVLTNYGDVCHLCGKPGAKSVDHLIPRSRGGGDDLNNLRPAHGLCNSRRGAHSVEWFQRRYAPHMLPEQQRISWNGWAFFKK